MWVFVESKKHSIIRLAHDYLKNHLNFLFEFFIFQKIENKETTIENEEKNANHFVTIRNTRKNQT